MDRATIDAVLDDWTTAQINERLRAALQLVETMTRHPQDLDAQLLGSLHERGLEREAVEDAATIAFQFNIINRFADALAFPKLDEQQRIKVAKMLDFMARVGGRRAYVSVRGSDGVVRPVELERGRKLVLSSPGHSSPQLREAVEAKAARWFAAQRPEPAQELDQAVCNYTDKVARWAYKVVDEDIGALAHAGHDEQAIFELTYAAALGVAAAGVEQLYALL